ncbi:MAG: transcription termination factor Rho [Planctomycetes bacterium]|nr:transcription termination factor Rho [Planctomycetota bacterium]
MNRKDRGHGSGRWRSARAKGDTGSGRVTARTADPAPPPGREKAPVEGLFSHDGRGGGFLRQARNRYLPVRGDVFVPAEIAQRFKLRSGGLVKGEAFVGGSWAPHLASVATVDGLAPEDAAGRVPFEERTVIDPEVKFDLGVEGDVNLRVLDLLTPIGKGQRALILAPPRSGKTVLLQKIARTVRIHAGVELLVLLVNERPEEVTEFRRAVGGEVVSSSLDDRVENHALVADMVLERAKRLAEMGKDVVLVVDSLTRLARAHNLQAELSGRTMSGGIDAKALERPRRIFGAARKLEGAGSLTIVATVLVDTGSRGDQVIYEEFKGTGNMELALSRELSNLRIWPAVDIEKSGTRKEEKLIDVEDLRRVRALRRVLSRAKKAEAMEILVAKMSATKNNREFLDLLDREMKSAKTKGAY